jgi:dethiobiotin synthetase
MSCTYFITGTDTDAGKTWIALALLTALRKKGCRTLAMKPVACGCQLINGAYRNDDALKLQQHASVSVSYETVNPYALPAPIAPHFAAKEIGQRIDVERIKQLHAQQQDKADYIIMEGVGGWMVPLNERQTSADLVKILNVPVILVAGIRLGCLNHTLLTDAAIRYEGIRFAGWIANCVDKDCLAVEKNIQALRERLSAPLLGVVPYLEEFDAQTIADCLGMQTLIED